MFLKIGLALVCSVLLLAASSACGPASSVSPTRSSRPAFAPTLRPVQFEVLPATLRPGMRALLVALGFERGERVGFYLTRPDGTRTTEGVATADVSGDAAYELDLVGEWKPGIYVAHVESKSNPSRSAERQVQFLRR